MNPIYLLIPVAIVAIVLAVLLAAANAALLTLSRHAIERSFADSAKKERILRFYDDANTTFAVLSLARVFAETTYAVAITAFMYYMFDGWIMPLIWAIVVTGLVSFVGASVSPRTLGRRVPEKTIAALSWLVSLSRLVLSIPAKFLIHISNALTPGGKISGGPFASEEELRHLVDKASEGDALEDEERSMIQGVFELGDTKIRELMVPRPDMVTIEAEATASQAMRLFVRSGFSRVPVIGEGVDDLLGMLYFKDVMRSIHSPWNPGADRPVTSLMRPVVFFPEFLPADAVMEKMRASRVHVGIPIDEYGGVSGIVTIEDILEEIVGEIADEHDKLEQVAEDLGDGSFRVPSRMSIDEVGELFDIDLEDDDVDTIGGLLAKTLGKVPILGSEGEALGVHMSVDRVSGRRKQVSAIVVSRVHEGEAESEAQGEGIE